MNNNQRLTDGVNLVHEDDAGLVVSGIVEHLSDQPGAFTDVFVHDGTGDHLQHRDSQVRTGETTLMMMMMVVTLTFRKLQSN